LFKLMEAETIDIDKMMERVRGDSDGFEKVRGRFPFKQEAEERHQTK
jgi:hypothetical protein